MHRLFLLVLFCHSVHLIHSSWWYLSQFDKQTVKDPRNLCLSIPNLPKKQRQLCRRYPELTLHLIDGLHLAIQECQHQFRFHKWNCSTFENDYTVFGKFLVQGGEIRELAFVNALTSASATYTLAKACAMGTPQNCGCRMSTLTTDSTGYGKNTNSFTWEGCDESLRISMDFVKNFVNADDAHNVKDAKSKITKHNNRVGRLAVMKGARQTCKCHGLSGACTMESCWTTLRPFRQIGDELRDEYDQATKVTFDPHGRLRPVNKHQRRPRKHNLVYLDESPDFCRPNFRKGILGTENRLCNNTSEGEDSCDLLCCGSNHMSIRKSVLTKCECSFQWCCKVECKSCKEDVEEFYCKPPPPIY